MGIENSYTSEIVGIFPLAQIKNFTSGSKLISFPLTTHCEPLIEEEQIKKIFDKMTSYCGDNLFLEIRSLDYSCNLEGVNLNENFLIHILELEESEDETFKKFHGTSVRASIRRAEKKGLTFELDNSINGLKSFYSLYANLRKRLGLPILKFNFFESVYINLFKDNKVLIPLVKSNNFIIAAGFILKFKDTYYLEYTASDNSKLDLYPNHILFWEVIKIAIRDKAKYVDFGRTEISNNSLIAFKDKWNTKRKQLKYWQIGSKQKVKPLPGICKSFIVKVNKHLPASLLKLQGKIIYKYNG